VLLLLPFTAPSLVPIPFDIGSEIVLMPSTAAQAVLMIGIVFL
jgi:hypothetical protein